MNKKHSMILTITAVAVLGATLLGGTFTQSQIGTQSIDMSKMDADILRQIQEMGGLQLVMPQAFSETDCGALESTGRNVVRFDLTGESVMLPIMGHTADKPKEYYGMSFNQQVPGPTLRVQQGDVVMMTLTIPADEVTGHGNDMHASQMSAGNFDSVNPGEVSEYCYIAETAGVFKYHCSGVHLIGMDQHVLSGMYGIAIVDPADGYKKLMVEKTTPAGEIDRMFYDSDALEFQLQYNQLYLTEDGKYDGAAMFKHHNTGTVVNGFQFGYVPNSGHNDLIKGNPNSNIFVAQPWNAADLEQYQSQLLFVETGQPVRFFIENTGHSVLYLSGDKIPVGMIDAASKLLHDACGSSQVVAKHTTGKTQLVMASAVIGATRFDSYDPLGQIPSDLTMDWDDLELGLNIDLDLRQLE